MLILFSAIRFSSLSASNFVPQHHVPLSLPGSFANHEDGIHGSYVECAFGIGEFSRLKIDDNLKYSRVYLSEVRKLGVFSVLSDGNISVCY
jgi:hypothetical protein